MDTILFWSTFSSGLTLFILYNSHFLMTIISLEIMMLSVFYKFAMNNLPLSSTQFIIMFMVVMVCLGGYGISMVVKTSRLFGKETSYMY